MSSVPAIPPDGLPAARAEAAEETPLDLTFDPALPTQPEGQTVLQQAVPVPAERRVEAPFSLGIKIKTQSDTAGPPRRVATDQQEPPTLADKVEGLVERSTFGVTGTYRF